MVKLENGIYQMEDGRLKVDTSAKCPRTGRLKRVRRTLTPDATLEEARETREQIKTEIRGVLPEERARLTLGAYAAAWIDRRSRRLKPSAEAFYRTVLASYLVPYLGDLYCDAMLRSDLDDYARWLETRTTRAGRPLAHRSMMSYWRGSLVLLEDLAIDFGLNGLTARVEPPRSSRRGVRESRTLTGEQLGRLVGWFERHPHAKVRRRYPEVCVLAYTGMRSGELWALKTDALDGDTIRVEASISDGVWTDRTKTGVAREVYAPRRVREAIAAHRQAMLREEHPGLASGLIFPDATGRPRGPGSLRKVLETACDKLGLGLRVTPQVLRRTYNTLLMQADVDRIVLRSQMGHADEAMTELYSGVGIEAKKEAHLRVFGGGGVE